MPNFTRTFWPFFCISRPRGMRSSETTVGGSRHIGLKLRSVIGVRRSGVGRSGLPTTPAYRATIAPFSTASICAAGMLTTTYRFDVVGDGFLQARQIDLQLLQAGVGRHVQGGDRPLVGDAGRRQAVRCLEPLKRLLDFVIEIARGRIGAAQVAGGRQAGAQQRDGGIGRPELHEAVAGRLGRRLGNLRPAALPHDHRVLADRHLGGFDIRFGERRIAFGRVGFPFADEIGIGAVGRVGGAVVAGRAEIEPAEALGRGAARSRASRPPIIAIKPMLRTLDMSRRARPAPIPALILRSPEPTSVPRRLRLPICVGR